MSSPNEFPAPIAEEIWNLKYRFKAPVGGACSTAGPYDATLDDTFARVARAAAQPEKGGKRARDRWARRFHDAMSDLSFLPGGRILAGAGTGRKVTLFNCFVMGRVEDDLSSIFTSVKEAALTMQQGGGIGQDFSTLRPKGALVASIGADASGPVSFMEVWDAMCRTIQSAGARRGAMMACMRADHPDIELFIDAKSEPGRLTNFNLSVLVSDAFMRAVEDDAPWDLTFNGKVYRTIEARQLWGRIMRATYDYAEPGVIFIDRVNAMNNLAYCETISATNPCGEQPLPAYGACLLGAVNLTRFVDKPFARGARLDIAKLEDRVGVAVRFLDNIIDVSHYPLPAQRKEALAKRRIGLGVTGLADALILVGERYGSDRGAQLASSWMSALKRAAYRASAELAAEKGAFPLFDSEQMLARPNLVALDADTRRLMARSGLRNGCLTTIAPTGTTSLLAGNVSSGIEPVFDLHYRRRVVEPDGSPREEEVQDYAYALFRAHHGPDAPLPATFVTAQSLAPREHLAMQAVIQPHVDSAISKTINCPETLGFDAFELIYAEAYALGLKGCTTYRPNPVTGAVLTAATVEDHDSGPSASTASALPPSNARPATEPRPAAEASLPARAAPPMPPAISELDRSGGSVVYMSKPLERDAVLAGYTYKLKWPESEHALYITINDIECEPGPGGERRRRPFEIFINTKNLEHYAWTVALTRMISAVFRRGGDVTFIAEELKAVFDPQGGRWIKGRYVPSLLAAIGQIIEDHMVRIGFLAPQDHAGSEPPATAGERGDLSGPNRRQARARHCPRCSSAAFHREEGCWVCRNCGFSRCG